MTDNQNGQNGHVDGDDYTWNGGVFQAAAVFNPLDELAAWDMAGGVRSVPVRVQITEVAQGQPGRYSLLDELSEMEPAQVGPAEPWEEWRQRTAALFDPAAGPDLRTLAEREQDDIARLERRLAWLERELGLLIVRADKSTRLAQLERTVAALVRVLEVRLP